MPPYRTILFVLFLPLVSFSNPIDSLRNLIRKEQQDSTKSYLCYKLSYQYLQERNLDSLLFFARAGKILAEQAGHNTYKVLNMEMEGQYFYYLALYPSAIRIFSEALELSEKLGMTQSVGRAHGMFGWIYIEQRRFKDALLSFKKSRELNSIGADGEGEDLALAYYGIGSVYSYQSSPLKNDSLAILYYDSALSTHTGLKLRERAFVLAELGFTYRSYQKDIKKCLSFLLNAEKLLLNDLKNLDTKAYIKAELAYAYIMTGEKAKARRLANEAEKLYTQIPYYQQVPSTYSLLSQVFHQLGDESNAFEMERKNRVLSDSIHSFRNIRLVEEVRAEYEDKKRLLEIARLKEEGALIQVKAYDERILLLVVGGSGFMLFLIVLFAFYKRAKYQARIETIEARHKIKEEKERIAQDLHDSLGGQLSSISVGINRIVESNPEGPSKAIQQLVDKALLELRDSLWVMDNESISFSELEQRINGLFWQYRSIEVPIELSIQVEQALAALHLPAEKTGHLYRILQEATHNCIKHSQASFLKISMRKKQDQAEIRIEDDGIGFDFSVAIKNGHHGLHNIRHRAEKIGAKLKIESLPNNGFAVLIAVPLGAE